MESCWIQATPEAGIFQMRSNYVMLMILCLKFHYWLKWDGGGHQCGEVHTDLWILQVIILLTATCILVKKNIEPAPQIHTGKNNFSFPKDSMNFLRKNKNSKNNNKRD